MIPHQSGICSLGKETQRGISQLLRGNTKNKGPFIRAFIQREKIKREGAVLFPESETLLLSRFHAHQTNLQIACGSELIHHAHQRFIIHALVCLEENSGLFVAFRLVAQHVNQRLSRDLLVADI